MAKSTKHKHTAKFNRVKLSSSLSGLRYIQKLLNKAEQQLDKKRYKDIQKAKKKIGKLIVFIKQNYQPFYRKVGNYHVIRELYKLYNNLNSYDKTSKIKKKDIDNIVGSIRKVITNIDDYINTTDENSFNRLTKISNLFVDESEQDTNSNISKSLERNVNNLQDLLEKYDIEYKSKLPLHIKEGKYKKLKLPIMFSTKHTLTKDRLRTLKFTYHEMYPGYIFDKQLVIAMNITDYNSPVRAKIISKVQDRYPNHHFVNGDIGLFSEETKRVVYLWLMKRSTFLHLNSPKIVSCSFPFKQKETMETNKTKRLQEYVEELNSTYKQQCKHRLSLVAKLREQRINLKNKRKEIEDGLTKLSTVVKINENKINQPDITGIQRMMNKVDYEVSQKIYQKEVNKIDRIKKKLTKINLLLRLNQELLDDNYHLIRKRLFKRFKKETSFY